MWIINCDLISNTGLKECGNSSLTLVSQLESISQNIADVNWSQLTVVRKYKAT